MPNNFDIGQLLQTVVMGADWMEAQEKRKQKQKLLDYIMKDDNDGIYPKSVTSKGDVSYGIRTPEERKEAGFQRKAGEFEQARRTIGGARTGGEMGPTPRYLAARGKYEQLRPSFPYGVDQTEKGAFKPRLEYKPRTRAEKLSFAKEKGVAGRKAEPTYDPALTKKVISNITTPEDIDDLLENKADYKEAGVDVGAVLREYLQRTDEKEVGPTLMQKIREFLKGSPVGNMLKIR